MWNVELTMRPAFTKERETRRSPTDRREVMIVVNTNWPCGVLLSKNTDITDAHGLVFSRIG